MGGEGGGRRSREEEGRKRKNVLPMFSSRSFMLSCLMFMSLSHFEFIFVHGVRVCSSFIDLYATVQVSQQHFLKRKDCLFPFFFFWSLPFSWVTPTAYGGSQARGLIGAVAASLRQSHTNAGSKPHPSRVCNLHRSSRQRRIVNPLSKGRDRTRNLMVPSRIR